MNNPWEDIQLPVKDLNVKRVDATHPIALYWSRNQTGDYLFLVADVQIGKGYEMPSVEGIRFVVMPSPRGGHLFNCILVLNKTENWELFHSICLDLVHAMRTSDSATAFECMLLRLRKWREFLLKRKSDSMTEEKLRGLIGELLFMERELSPRFGWHDTISLWTGPQGSPQDFSVQNTAVEVKAKLSTARKEVRISSAEQLESLAKRLYLHVVTLGKCAAEDRGSFSLNMLVERIVANFDSSAGDYERFADLLMGLGYSPDCPNCRLMFKFVESSTYEVRDGFPRLIPGMIPNGIVKVAYSISLDACNDYLAKPEWME